MRRTGTASTAPQRSLRRPRRRQPLAGIDDRVGDAAIAVAIELEGLPAGGRGDALERCPIEVRRERRGRRPRGALCARLPHNREPPAGEETTGAVAVPLMAHGGCAGVLAIELQYGDEQREDIPAFATIPPRNS